MSKFFQLLFYPFLFCLYPVLTLLAHNINEAQISDAYRSLVISLLLSILFLLFFRIGFKDWTKAALSSTLSLFLFFSYGHIYNLIKEVDFLGFTIGRHRYLILVWLSMFIFGIFFRVRKMRNPQRFTSLLNTIGVILLLIPAYNISAYLLENSETQIKLPSKEISWDTSSSPVEQNLPDIYYIILDAYSRDDFLLSAFQFNNSPFLTSLEQMGFYIARCSQSNYSQTKLSTSTTLNLNYLETFYDREVEGDIRQTKNIDKYIKNSEARVILQDLGYQTVAFETGWGITQLTDADYYLSRENKNSGKPGLFSPLNEFEALFIHSSALSFVIAVFPPLADILLPFFVYPNQNHREIVLFTLDQLERIPSLQGPKFIFAHILSPHKPFVFGPNGELLIKEPSYRKGYPNQINYLNKRIEHLVKQIIQNSAIPPIIILQGDHGAGEWVVLDGRLAILNAYYFPEGGSQHLYPSISPVNTFRLIFNTYFGMDYELLEDVSYYSPYPDPQSYTIISNSREGCDN